MARLKKIAFIICGSIAIGLGILGILLPLLPTTPFLLLGAACYLRSSNKLYQWLINNKWLGSYIKNYYEGNGITLKTKIVSISLLWMSISYTALFLIEILLVKILLLFIAIGVTKHLLSLKTLVLKKKEQPSSSNIEGVSE